MAPLSLMESLARVLPDDVAVVEEAHDDHGLLFRAGGHVAEHRRLFRPARAGLGWGLNCAIGVRLAWPDRPVWR